MRRWGSVEGDGEADVIISQRRANRLGERIVGLTSFVLTIIFAIWFAITGSSGALALEIIAAAGLTIFGVGSLLYKSHTMLLIAERRIQLVEQQMQELRDAIK